MKTLWIAVFSTLLLASHVVAETPAFELEVVLFTLDPDVARPLADDTYVQSVGVPLMGRLEISDSFREMNPDPPPGFDPSRFVKPRARSGRPKLWPEARLLRYPSGSFFRVKATGPDGQVLEWDCLDDRETAPHNRKAADIVNDGWNKQLLARWVANQPVPANLSEGTWTVTVSARLELTTVNQVVTKEEITSKPRTVTIVEEGSRFDEVAAAWIAQLQYGRDPETVARELTTALDELGAKANSSARWIAGIYFKLNDYEQAHAYAHMAIATYGFPRELELYQTIYLPVSRDLQQPNAFLNDYNEWRSTSRAARAESEDR